MNVPPPLKLLSSPPPPPPPIPVLAPTISSPSRVLSSDESVLPPMFDASRPPPPRLADVRENGKHKISDLVETGPSKIRKPEHSKACSDNLCEKCVQRQIRIDMYKQQMEQLLAEDEKRNLAYKKKLQTLENAKQLIKSCYSKELNHFIEEYIEDKPDSFQELLSQCTTSTSVPRYYETMDIKGEDIKLKNSKSQLI